MSLIINFLTLFSGLDRAYGVFNTTGEVTDKGKAKGKAFTKQGTVTAQLWDDHLSGKQRLGIVPIKDSSECLFGAIDIDEYQINIEKICQVIENLKLPLVPCRSKSGGLHCYIFCKEPIPAEIIRDKLADMASSLGFAGVEIFPKQDKLASPEDVGNWINMPYFDHERTMTYGIKNGKPLSTEDFITYAHLQAVSMDD